MNIVFGATTLGVATYVALKQTPESGRKYRTNLHQLQHLWGSICGYGEKNTHHKGHEVDGYVCSTCGHLNVYSITAKEGDENYSESAKADWNNSWRDNVDGDVWTTPEEWRSALKDFNDKN